MSSRPRRVLWILGLLILTLVAFSFRLAMVPGSSALGDAMHPWWAALRGGWPRPHAPPYGWGLVACYRALLVGAGDLVSAVQRLALVHALAAPIAAYAALRLGGRMVPSLVIGLIVACDPGLLDTVRSGAEGYLAGVWIGAMMLGLGARWRWAPAWSLACFAMALMHHPLAVCALPLLWGLSWRSRATWVGLGLAAAMLAPRVLRGMREALPTGAGQGDPLEALPAYLGQGEAIAVLVLAGPLIGLVSPRTRATALRTLVAAAIMLALGLVSGYLRDHHLRILTVPALLGWSAVPWPASVLAGLLILAPSQREAAAEVMDRPGTVGLTQQVSAVILAEVEPPLVVDGAWLSGGPVASPAGVLLDLHLRGLGASSLRPGGAVVVVVSAEREARAGVSSGALRRLELGQALLLVGTESDVRTWSLDHCEARLGGAWDALSVLHPQITVDRTRDWWACP